MGCVQSFLRNSFSMISSLGISFIEPLKENEETKVIAFHLYIFFFLNIPPI